ncbi:tRNA(Met) cytidine acetyltransferase TmcA [Marinobacter halophilus]|uniref:tRNA(Met) cytidine acetyltransferase TmcA n=1 Tax=Marinobacter halophilus TaxID=1323740 RepID=A0A2T1KFH8_9GAMM|nr:GNAT family N-acetyltransferase [Marinobacter halophilus]PSF08884.1 tRNA(Met) cytidine acetyltransferase [Marinobacter halophilus]GGC64797.1 tRNA(Met) cytidine acetyltransferase TmcA [Marinobacter halophilus]
MTTDPTSAPEHAWSDLQAALAAQGHRRLVLVEGDQQHALAWIRQQLPQLNTSHSLWIGRPEHAEAVGMPHLQASQYRQWLGRETSLLIWDGWQGNPPDAIAALSGTLQAGGLLFWLMPALASWPDHADPDYARTGLEQAQNHPFAARLARKLAQDPSVIRVRARASAPPDLPELPTQGSPFLPGTTEQQQDLIQQLLHFGQGRRRRPLVITADRGRGKSAALGIAAARLLLAGRQRVIVTAPSRDNLHSLFRHAVLELAEDLAEQSEVELITRGGQRLSFVPVRELLFERPEAEVVLVDEAAGLPAHWLRDILLGWPRVAFASTVHGYEGTGRGFAIRFRDILDRETPQWRGVSIQQPVRWAPGDPLEKLVFEMFLLAAEGPASSIADAAQVTLETWSPSQASEVELAEAFGLLVDAHYRTTPADLRQWLDDPAAQSWRALYQGRTVGVLWGAVEGGLSEELADQVVQGKRRLRGHLLAQSLASHGGFPEAAKLRTLRIVRIAVSEQARHLGIGRRLVAAAATACQQQGLDTLGTSFGGNRGLLAFWQASGLQVVRVGLQQEATTGEFPLQLLQGLSPAGTCLAQRLRARFAHHWQVLIPRHWSVMDPHLLAAVGADLPPLHGLDAEDRRDLTAFAEGFRGFELTLPVLQALAAGQGAMTWFSTQPALALWCHVVLQGWSWREVQLAGLCTGQRDGEQQLRQLVCQLLQNGPEL